jgi:type IV pilus assembly protein PilA
MKLLNKKEGFTLIEMMIVVVIIGILAAIAIPQFLRYQLKSKTSEAPRNLGAIRTNEEAFSAKFGSYAQAANRPAAAPSATKGDWGVSPVPPTSGFDTIGFSPSGKVFYQYAIGPATTLPDPTAGTYTNTVETLFNTSGDPDPVIAVGTGIVMVAVGNVDGNADFASFYQTNLDSKIVGAPPVAGETVF